MGPGDGGVDCQKTSRFLRAFRRPPPSRLPKVIELSVPMVGPATSAGVATRKDEPRCGITEY